MSNAMACRIQCRWSLSPLSLSRFHCVGTPAERAGGARPARHPGAVLETVLADAAENLYPARMQMALSLGWHIVFSCFGMAFPMIVVFTEWRAHVRGNPVLMELAHTWAKAMGVLFAAGAVSGTLLSFEMGILWPGLMEPFGEVFGFPFVLEGFAFFLEAIFVGIYLFGWDRMSPRAHMLSAFPMILSGLAGAFFVIAANAWMNNPTGFDLTPDGKVINADPVGAMFGPSTWPQFFHMAMAAYMVTGFLIASVYAVGMLRGRRDLYHRYGLMIRWRSGASPRDPDRGG